MLKLFFKAQIWSRNTKDLTRHIQEKKVSKGHLPYINVKVFFISNFLTKQDGKFKFGV